MKLHYLCSNQMVVRIQPDGDLPIVGITVARHTNHL